MKIWKYELELTDIQFIKVPYKSQILSVQVQNDILCMWAIVDDYDIDVVNIKINIVGTRNPIENNLGVFIDTVQNNGFVWHVFARPE